MPPWLRALLMVAIVLAGAAVYWVARSQRPIIGLGNHDVAGITYNADLILRGGMPYVDTVEIKAPGAFYLVALAFTVLGRSVHTVHLACELWLCLGMLGVWWGTTRVYTLGAGDLRTARWSAAIACGLYWLTFASFQSNYTTWIVPPTAWCFACAVHSWHHRGWWWPFLTGLSAGVAFLIKANAVVLAPTVVAMWFIARRAGAPYARWGAWPLWILGGVSAGIPLAAHYLAEGVGLEVLFGGVFPLKAAASYSERVVDAPFWYVPWRVVLHLEAKFPLQIMAIGALLGSLVVHRWMGDSPLRRGEGVALSVLLVFAVFSVAGGGLGGMRYFRHYAPQYLPALCILSAHPVLPRTITRLVTDVRTRLDARRTRGEGKGSVKARRPLLWDPGAGYPPWRRTGATLALWGVLLGFGGHAALEIDRGARLIQRGKYSHGWRPSTADRKIARFIERNSNPDERVFIWGWRGWSIYFYADRYAPTPMYKSLGTITTYNFNGMFMAKKSQRPRRLHFVPGPHADALVEAFRTDPPAFVVRAKPFFDGARGDPMNEFDALKDELDSNYEKIFRSGKLTLFEHSEHRTRRLKRQGKRRPLKKKRKRSKDKKTTAGKKKRKETAN